MAFRYRFQSILSLRAQQRDEAGAAVGKALEAIHRIDEQMEAIANERELLRDHATRERTGNVSVDGLLTHGRYDLQLQAQIQSLTTTRAELQRELERRQQTLLDAEAEVKRFERLEERDRLEYRNEQSRREQAESDDAVASRYTLSRRR